MIHGRTGPRPLDYPAYDDLIAPAARWRQPIFIHPQILPNQLRDAAYRGLDPLADLGLTTFGWGWHKDAGLSALRLILRSTFDRHPDLQLVFGHWGEMLLFWIDRITGSTRIPRSAGPLIGERSRGRRGRGSGRARPSASSGPKRPTPTASNS